jgi:hypothetical protein
MAKNMQATVPATVLLGEMSGKALRVPTFLPTKKIQHTLQLYIHK